MREAAQSRLVALLLVFCGAAIASGCAQTNSPLSRETLTVVRVDYDRQESSFAHLRADYGCLIDWPGQGTPAFYVFDRQARRRFKTDDWDEFLSELAKLPAGIAIDRVEKCTAGFAWGMPDEKRGEFKRVLDARSIRLMGPDDPWRTPTICTCESLNYRVLADAR
jgi:hypothetical protein